jgi:hypothetical protein
MFLLKKSYFNSKFTKRFSTYRVLFFGSDKVSLESLKALHSRPELVSRLEVVVSGKFNQCRKNNNDEVRKELTWI